MKFLIALFAIFGMTSAGIAGRGLYETAIVEGPKAIIAGPSGTIHADTGSITKSGAHPAVAIHSQVIAHPSVAVHSHAIAHPAVLPHAIAAPAFAVDHHAYGGHALNAGLVGAPLYGSSLLGAHYGADLLGHRAVIGSPLLGHHSLDYGYDGLY